MPDDSRSGWQVGYTSEPHVIDYRHWERTEADARAALLIYLTENELVSV